MNGLPAFRATHHRIERRAACLMLVQDRPAALVRHMDVAPMHERHDDWIKIKASLRQNIFMPRGPGLIRNPPKDAEADQLLKARREQMARNPEIRLKLLKSADPQKTFTQNEQSPAVPDHG